MRLDKFLAHTGYGTRKDVKILIKQKRVLVNEELTRDASLILDTASDVVQVDGEVVHYEKDIYIMMNKPAGYICAHDAVDYPSVLELIEEYHNDLFFVGRLDADTEGLLLITNDGTFSHKVAHAKKEVTKQYYVELETVFNQDFIAKLNEGIPLDETMLKPAQVEMVTDKSLLLTISEGKYHQVKRMMHYCENEVTYLKRIKIGALKLDDTLNLGEYRNLTSEEINLFM